MKGANECLQDARFSISINDIDFENYNESEDEDYEFDEFELESSQGIAVNQHKLFPSDNVVIISVFVSATIGIICGYLISFVMK